MNAESLKVLLAAATPGPWVTDPKDPFDDYCIHQEGIALAIAAVVNGEMRRMGGKSDEHDANARLIALAPELAADNIALQAEVERLRELLGKCVGILDATMEESGRSVEYGEEDPFRMGEWFEEDDMIAIEAARAALNETPDTASVLPR